MDIFALIYKSIVEMILNQPLIVGMLIGCILFIFLSFLLKLIKNKFLKPNGAETHVK